MTEPIAGTGGGLGGSFKIADAFVNVELKDSASPQLKRMTGDVGNHVESTGRIITQTIGRVGGSLHSLTGMVAEPIFALTEGFERAEGHAESLRMKVAQTTTTIGAGLMAAGGALVLMGAREKQSTDQLERAIANAGGEMSSYKDEIEKVIKTQERYGRTALQTKDTLTTLTNATHDPTKALELMAEASDLAAVRHISLNSAALLVARGINGSGRVFKQFGIEVKTNAQGVKDYAAANEELARVIKGQAEAATNNFIGTLKHVGAVVDDTAAKFGEKFGGEVAGAGAALTLLGSIMQIRAARIVAGATVSAAATTAADAEMAVADTALAAITKASSDAMGKAIGKVTIEKGLSAEAYVAASALMATSEEALAVAQQAAAASIVSADEKIAAANVAAAASSKASLGAGLASASGMVARLGPIGVLAAWSATTMKNMAHDFSSYNPFKGSNWAPDWHGLDFWNHHAKKATQEQKNLAEATKEEAKANDEMAKSLGVSAGTYAAATDKIAKKRDADAQAAAETRIFLALDDQLRNSLGMDADKYQALVAPIVTATEAQVQFGDSVRAAADVHQQFDPALKALDTWEKSSKALKDAQDNQAQTAETGARSIRDAENAVSAAQDNMVTTAEQGAESVKNAEQAVTDAYTNGADSIAQAEQKVADSQRSAKDAQLALLQARKDAAQQIKDAIHSTRDLKENEDKARIALAKAKLDASVKNAAQAQAALNTNINLSPAQAAAEQARIDKMVADNTKEAARLAALDSKYTVIDAQHNLDDTIANNTKVKKDANQVLKDGIKNNPAVIKAQQALMAANKAEAQSVKDLAKVRDQAADAEMKAQAALVKARRDASRANASAAASEGKAEQSLTDTRKSVAKANAQAIQATKDAAKANDDNRHALNLVEGQSGLTDKSLKALGQTIQKMDKNVDLQFNAKNKQETMDAITDLKRSIEETLLIAGGTSVADATKKAISDNPKYKQITVHVPGHGDRYYQVPTGLATGGAVQGPGTTTSDSIPIMASNDEHMWSAQEVAGAGGHAAMERMRKLAREGKIKGYATGGMIVDFSKMDTTDIMKHGPLAGFGAGYSPGGGTGGFTGAVSAGTGDNMMSIWKGLRSAGMIPAQAAGVMGNMWAESGFNPFIIQGGGTSMDPSAAGGGGYGLVQWTPGSKLIPLLHGKAPSIQTEIAALVEQLNGSEGSAGAALRSSINPAQAAAVFGLQYERYAGPPQQDRSDKAVEIFKQYGKYDEGGWLPPGKSIVENKTGKPEPVLTGDQWDKLLENKGVHIENFHLEVQSIDDVQHLMDIIHGIPQAVRRG